MDPPFPTILLRGGGGLGSWPPPPPRLRHCLRKTFQFTMMGWLQVLIWTIRCGGKDELHVVGEFTVAGQMPVFGQLPVVRCRGTGITYLCWDNKQFVVPVCSGRRELPMVAGGHVLVEGKLSVAGIEEGTVTF